MSYQTTLFSSITTLLPRDYFNNTVRRLKADRYVKSFSSWNLFMVMLWAQLSNRLGLREIVNNLSNHTGKFYHMGFGSSVSRSTLSEALEKRDAEVFRLMAVKMMELAQVGDSGLKAMSIDGLGCRLSALDSTTIILGDRDLHWTRRQQGNAGLKLHVMYDLLARVPSFVILTGHDVRDQSMMRCFDYQEGRMHVFDKAYLKLPALREIASKGAFFIVRRKRKMRYVISEDLTDSAGDTSIVRDARIRLSNRWAKERYPEELRIVVAYDSETNRTFEFLTNNFDISPQNIAMLYQRRWGIELFFRWIKQHLRVTRFWGRTENAIKIQIYVAIIAYCLIAIIRHNHAPGLTNLELARKLQLSMFEKTTLQDFLSESPKNDDFDLQLRFDF